MLHDVARVDDVVEGARHDLLVDVGQRRVDARQLLLGVDAGGAQIHDGRGHGRGPAEVGDAGHLLPVEVSAKSGWMDGWMCEQRGAQTKGGDGHATHTM